MVTKDDVEKLRDKYRERFDDGDEREPYKSAYRNLLIAIKKHYSRTFWEYYTSLKEEMPEEIEQTYSKLKRVLELRVIENPEPDCV